MKAYVLLDDAGGIEALALANGDQALPTGDLAALQRRAEALDLRLLELQPDSLADLKRCIDDAEQVPLFPEG